MRILIAFVCMLFVLCSNAQLLSTSPAFPKETDGGVSLTCDATLGSQGLLNHDPNDVYVHIGAITTASTSSSDWKYVNVSWGTTNPAYKAVSSGTNKWTYTLTGADMRAFFGMSNASEHVLKIAILFRSGNGSKKLANTDGTDMYVPVYDAAFYAKITNPFRQPKYIPVPETITKNVGDAIAIEAKATQASNMKLFFNGSQVASQSGVSTISASPVITVGGTQRIIAEAELGGTFKRDTIDFFVTAPVVVEALPAGVKQGINYESGDTSVTLVIYAPQKNRFSIVGDFNNWTETPAHQMKKTPDGNFWWLRVTGLTPGVEYGYQYIIDGTLKLADYNTEKVLDPSNDQFIPAVTYPGLKPYPTGKTTGLVSVLQTAKPAYTWSSGNFVKPDKRNLVMYELLLRDFIARHDWQTLTDTLTYLRNQGINAIHVMPFNEFEGNISWGYNPSFFFAPDKYYGTENQIRRFVDSAHKKGIAVIMDMVLNHSYSQSPMVQMYWDAANSRPATNSPWYNPTAPHTWLEFGYDFNHEAQATKDFTDRVVEHWLAKYHIDGIRWDFTKGFSQRSAPTEGASAAYDASRIAILKRIYDKMQAVSPGSISVLEHFCANTEEIELANYGMLLWGNTNYNYTEASTGTNPYSNFSGVLHTQRGWSVPHLLGYAESHDEERLNYRNLVAGNSSQAPAYDIKNPATALKRQEMVAAFFLPLPGPKLIWQFGELGYDYSINRCEDGSINNGCRLSPKPIVWHYLSDPNRVALKNVYAKLAKLRTWYPNLAGAFTTSNITANFGGLLKYVSIVSDSLKLMIVGNFDVVPQAATVQFPEAGTWYSYLTGSTFTAISTPQTVYLQPGEYYVYTNRNVDNIPPFLPVTLVSFTGSRTSAGNTLNWQTTQEVDLKHFELEFSTDGSTFNKIAVVNAASTSNINNYAYTDARSGMGGQRVFYRLKMVDKNGTFKYSTIVVLKPLTGKSALSVYPNPVQAGSIVSFEMPAAGMLTLRITNQAGQTIGQVFSGFKEKGAHQLKLGTQTQALSDGTYYLVMEQAGTKQVQTFSITN